MNEFDRLIEESYRGFGTSSFLELDELKLLYYGRRAIYITFTDQGEIYTESQENELHRPDSILCYHVNDVVGRKVNSPEFYANIFRPVMTGRNIEDVRRYTRDDLKKDLETLFAETNMDVERWNAITQPVMRDNRIRFNFERLWMITEEIASELGGDHGDKWNRLLSETLEYSIISDPDGTGIISIGNAPVNLFLNYEKRVDIDILPIQKNRSDPRLHVRERVERKVRRMGVKRNRIAKRRVRTRSV